jgi:SAM-dependent methyltransferase
MTPRLVPLVRGKVGLEIGGPSPIFARGGLLPVYRHIQRMDNCNFSSHTLWEGAIEATEFRAGRMPGSQIIAEGGDLGSVGDGAYEVLLSSHMLEHTANPLGTLLEWYRVLAPAGVLVLVLPHRDGTFDHRRPVTTLEHLRMDRDRGTTEDDATHIEEILQLHDLRKDPGVANELEFRARAERNFELRSLHHHVFDTRLALAAVGDVGFVPIMVEALEPYHIVVVAMKPPLDGVAHLTSMAIEESLRQSPFHSDRLGRVHA